MDNKALRSLIASTFPQDGVSLVFGYGSQIVKQSGNQQPSDLLDFVIVVDNPYEWHLENLHRNYDHYSIVKYLPNRVRNIVSLQENYGARIYFNPFVYVDKHIGLKYGVIKTDHLIEDLTLWNQLYIAGRLQKPVEFIVPPEPESMSPIQPAIRFNRQSAIRAATLQLPEIFSSSQLYATITGISYHGDLRMLFGEDKNKISNIVNGQKERFDKIYMPLMLNDSGFKSTLHFNEAKSQFTQDLASGTVVKNLELLPKHARQMICRMHSNQARSIEAHAILSSVANSTNCDKIVGQALARIVRRSSLSQSLKGLATAGLIKSLKYSRSKLAKSIKSRLSLASPST